MERQGGNKHIVSLPQKNKKFFLYLCSYILTQDYTTMTEDQNLASLFENLNQISRAAITQSRAGGSTGGGGMDLSGNMDANRLIGMNPYMGQNVTSFNMGGTFDGLSPQEYLYNTTGIDRRYDKGGQLTPAEYKKVSKLGRFGDTQLAHVTPEEANMLKAMGGSGTINPYTGLRENFRFNPFKKLRDIVDTVVGGATDILDPVIDTATDVLDPVFDVAGNVVESTVAPAADIVGEGAQFGLDLLDKGVKGATKGLKSFGFDFAMPMFETAATPVLKGMQYLNDLLTGGDDITMPKLEAGPDPKIRREEEKRVDMADATPAQLKMREKLSGLKKDTAETLTQGDFVGDKPNPFVTENVEEELDYAAEGMKYKYDDGGKENQNDYDPKDFPGLFGAKFTAPKNNIKGSPPGLFGPKYAPPQNTGGYKSYTKADRMKDVEEGIELRADKGMKLRNVLDSVRNEMATNPANMMNIINQVTAMKQAGDFMIGQANRANMNMNMKMAKGGAFKPHMMYDPKTGKGYKANKLQDHLDMKEKGYDHRKRNPKNYTNGGRF